MQNGNGNTEMTFNLLLEADNFCFALIDGVCLSKVIDLEVQGLNLSTRSTSFQRANSEKFVEDLVRIHEFIKVVLTCLTVRFSNSQQFAFCFFDYLHMSNTVFFQLLWECSKKPRRICNKKQNNPKRLSCV